MHHYDNTGNRWLTHVPLVNDPIAVEGRTIDYRSMPDDFCRGARSLNALPVPQTISFDST